MKKFLLILGLLLVTFSSFSQCWVEDLKNDLYAKKARENGFLDFFETDNLKKKEAYKVLHTEANDLKNNIEELSLVSKNLDEIKGVGGYVKWKALRPTRLIEEKNILRGSSTEYSIAKKRLKEYHQGELYRIENLGLPKEEKKLLIDELNKRNKAYIEGKIENFSFSHTKVRKSSETFQGEDIFSAYKVDKNGGINTPGSWIRNADTEYVMLSEIARDLGAKRGKVYPDIQGEIKLVSELPYCMSCQGVIQDFSTMFPNVKIVLIDNLKY